MKSSQLHAAIYDADVADRLALAHCLFRQFGPLLGQDQYVQELLATMHLQVTALNSHMAEMQLAPLCIDCASRPHGGCCSLFMAGETDSLQMLINLLAHIEVRQVRDDGSECCFLGPSGCLFLFKPFFCLNYNCTHIHRTATANQMQRLLQLTGSLLTSQYLLEQQLLAVIGQHSPFPGNHPV